jgi:hypothetical protein
MKIAALMSITDAIIDIAEEYVVENNVHYTQLRLWNSAFDVCTNSWQLKVVHFNLKSRNILKGSDLNNWTPLV